MVAAEQSLVRASGKGYREFLALCLIEPRLLDVFGMAARVSGMEPNYCANHLWISKIKPLMHSLAGWRAEKDGLRTRSAYDTAYHAIYEILPPCRDCGCFRE